MIDGAGATSIGSMALSAQCLVDSRQGSNGRGSMARHEVPSLQIRGSINTRGTS